MGEESDACCFMLEVCGNASRSSNRRETAPFSTTLSVSASASSFSWKEDVTHAQDFLDGGLGRADDGCHGPCLFAGLLKSESVASVRMWMMEALKVQKLPETEAVVLAALAGDASSGVRRRAAEVAAALGTPTAVAALRTAADKDTSRLVREAAVSLLKGLGP